MDQKGKRFFLSILSLLIIFIVLTGWVKQAHSQERYPTRAIDLICPWAPGGTVDLSSRFLADFLKKKWGVPVNVINKPGGGSVPGSLEVYQAAPDGYTMLADSQASCSFMEIAFKDLPFKVLDRTFVATVADAPIVFLCSPKSPWKTMTDLANEVKRDPENFTWVSIGRVGGSDCVIRQFFKAIGVDVAKTKPVVTRGMGEGNALVAGGHIKMSAGSTPSVTPHVKGGLLRAVGITKRMPELYRDLPTTAEQGYPTVDLIFWVGISGPPNLPSHILNKWEEALQEALRDPEYISKMKSGGSVLLYRNGREFKELVKKEAEEAAELWGVK